MKKKNTDNITIRKLSELDAMMQKNLITPITVETKAQAAKRNRDERALSKLTGLKFNTHWKVGMQYYVLQIAQWITRKEPA